MSFRIKALRRKGRLALLMLLAAALAGCTGEYALDPPASQPDESEAPIASAPASDVIAVIGGKPVYRSDFLDRLIAGYGSEVLREMLLMEAVSMEAARLGISVTEEELDRELLRMSEGYESESMFYWSMEQQLGMDREAVRQDARYRLLLEKLATKDAKVTEEQIRAYYEEHKEEYGPKKQMELSWILTKSAEEAHQVLQLLEEGADFQSLAARFSIDELTAEDGGNLGWIEQGDPFHDSRLLEAASQLNAGDAAGPIELAEGYAVIQLRGLKIIQGQQFNNVHDQIRRLLALEQAEPLREVERHLLSKYGAQVMDSRISLD